MPHISVGGTYLPQEYAYRKFFPFLAKQEFYKDASKIRLTYKIAVNPSYIHN
jgi:hypothetical protein